MTRQRAEEEESPKPSQPPEIERRIELRWPQLVGIPLIALLPVLAATGVLGEHWTKRESESARFRTIVEYPSLVRAKLSKPITVSIENRSAQSLDTVDVTFDSSYVERFAAADFIPSPHDSYVVSLTDVKPGETRRVHLLLEADLVGRHEGRIVVRTRDDSASVNIRTTVFP
jgi:hypothetical protein